MFKDEAFASSLFAPLIAVDSSIKWFFIAWQCDAPRQWEDLICDDIMRLLIPQFACHWSRYYLFETNFVARKWSGVE